MYVWKLLADVLDYHRSLIADTARCEAFYSAIQAVVKPGDVVVDIGAGAGLLSLFACHAGASRVYAIEQGAIGDVAERLFEVNGYSDRIQLMRGRSTNIDLPERVDVAVSETLWNFGLGEGIMIALADARARFLKPNGRLIPENLALRLAPVEDPEFDSRFDVWTLETFGVDLSPVAQLARNNVYRTVLERDALLAAPETLCELTLGEAPDLVHGVAEFVVKRRGVVHGLGGWFDARLCGGLAINNQPPNPAPSWKHAFFPLERPIAVHSGDLLRAEIQCVGDESAWRWAVRHVPVRFESRPTESHHSTLRGFPTALARACAP